jgi:hypothetical protein
MGPFFLIGGTYHKTKWAHSSSLAVSVIKNNGPVHSYRQHLPRKLNGPIQSYWHYVLKINMGPFKLIGSICDKK